MWTNHYEGVEHPMTRPYEWLVAAALVPATYLCGVSCRSTVSAAAQCGLMECVTDFELPRMTDGLDQRWFGTQSEASVTADFKISSEGRAAELTVSAPNQELSSFTSKYLTLSTFSTQCTGRKMRVVFEYKIVPHPVAMDLPAVSLRYRNTIRMVFAASGPSAPLQLFPGSSESRQR